MLALERADPSSLFSQIPTREDVLSTFGIFMGITLVGAALGGYYGNRYYDHPLSGAAIGATSAAVPGVLIANAFLSYRTS